MMKKRLPWTKWVIISPKCDSKILIDANRTKSFLDSLSKAFESSIHSGVKKASSQMPKEEDLGIKVENEKIEIDLNKIKTL